MTLVLYFVDNSQIQRLNRQFFHKSHLTDVIAFPLEPKRAEVFIAPSVVQSNAAAFNVDFAQELCRCVIHGMLHIFGFRDSSARAKNRMWAKQEKLLRRISKNSLDAKNKII